MTDTHSFLDKLSLAEKRSLLAELLRKKKEQETPRTTAPLSFAQQRLWFLHQLSPDSPFYNIPVGLRLSKPLNLKVLKLCIQEMVRRHEILRTTFPSPQGKPEQRIHPDVEIPVQAVDFRGQLNTTEAIQRLLIEGATRPFDLEAGPLMRVWLIDEATDSQILLLVLHHIIADGWSIGILLHELRVLYSAVSQGKASPLSELPLQYADFAVRQQKELQGAKLEQLLDYWRKQLVGLSMLTLPIDRPRPAVSTFQGARLFVVYPAQLTKTLGALGEREGCTLFMILLAAFFVLLHRYSGQVDLAVGSAIANRPRTELEGLLGFFVNTLVMRGDLSSDPSFLELLRRVQSLALDAYAHQDLPFEKLVEELQPERSLARNPLVQVMFTLQNAPLDTFSGADVDSLEIERGTANFDLVVDLWERADGCLGGRFEYSTDLFDAATIHRMSAHFGQLLDSIVATPNQAISKLSMLTERERQEVLNLGVETAAPYPRDCTIIDHFEEQVEQRPSAIVVSHNTTVWSYLTLDTMANTLAHRLIACGIGPGCLVALYLDRSCDLIAAQLAVLKADAAYVPLDIEYPSSRLEAILAETEVSVLISQRSLADRLKPFSIPAIWLDENPSQQDQNTGRPRRRPSDPNALAHIIYTSGSTGRPKGICIPHHAVLRLVCGTDYVMLEPGDRMAHASNPAFDAATFEIWGALLCGGTLVIVDRDVVLSPADFAAFLIDQKITTLFMTTALFNQIAATVPTAFASLRELLFGGEQVEPRWVREVLAKGAPGRLLHVYGPTESTTFATWHLIEAVSTDTLTIPIGRPIANTTAYVLEADMQPAPVGVPGELYLGGEGLALGYLKRPDLTATSFVDNPFGVGRLYRTGDIVRWRSNGVIEFLRRADTQVKIRGYRVELGEIETVLCQHPAIREAAVVAQEMGNERRLVTYFAVTHGDGTIYDSDSSSVESWQQIYNEIIYENVEAAIEPTLNTTGWRSNYTGKPLSMVEMREQVEQTVERLLSVHPRRVLEIGVGTGMLLFKVAPVCEAYWATDFSKLALDFLQQTSALQHLPQVTLLQRTADDFSELAPASFDLIVLNSVIQYFPSADYLVNVLEQSVQRLQPGGTIFCGDVRSLPLLAAFYTDVELERSPDHLPLDQLKVRVQRRLMQEEELVVDPVFFQKLRQRIPQIRAVQIWPKRGTLRNELMCYRYDVLITVGTDPIQPPQRPWTEWYWSEFGSCGALLAYLDRGQPETLIVRSIPNQRVAAAVRAAMLLDARDDGTRPSTVADLKRAVARDTATAVDPEELWHIAVVRSYEVELRFVEGQADQLDLLLRCHGVQIPFPAPCISLPQTVLADDTNNPRLGRSMRRLPSELRAFLQTRLPDYMVPSIFVPLPALPLTPNGKIDRRSLPLLDDRSDLPALDQIAPRNPLETQLASLWSEVLDLERVGIHDNFFDLGGHSLLVTQLVSRVRDALQVEVTIRDVFESPTVATFADSLQALSATEIDAFTIRPQSRSGNIPLSFAQERLWFLSQMFPESPVYNIQTLIQASLRLDPALLEQSLEALANRHEILRTTFPVYNGQPVQAIANDLSFPVEVIDLSTLPEQERSAVAHAHITEFTERPFDLARGPLLRVALLTIAEQEQIFLLVIHHIVADGWSMGIVLRELWIFYAAQLEGRTATLPELPIQYVDFALWQQHYLSGSALQSLLAYWRQQLQGLPTLRIPTDSVRPATPLHRGKRCSLTLTTELSTAVLDLGRTEGCTLFMTLLAALSAVLYRCTGQTDFAVGSPIANRTHAELEGLVGFFLNTLVLRVDLSGNPSFRTLMGRVRDVALGAYAHQELPFELLLQELRPERDLSRTPLFQVFLNVLNFSDSEVSSAVLGLQSDREETTAQFDLAFYAGDVDGNICFQLIYDTELFTQATAENLLHQLQETLNDATHHLDDPLSLLLLFGQEPQPAGPRPIPGDRFERFVPQSSTTILSRFLECAQQFPDQIAVETGDARCTYRELAARVAGVASSLVPYTDQRIALLFEPGISMVVAILGVMAAGAAYVPLDLAQPAQRLQKILDLADGVAVLTTTVHHTLAVELADPSLPIIDIDTLAPLHSPPPLEAIDPDAIAYILFTSGSTGEPKGVVQSQRHLLQHIATYTNALAISPDDGLLLLASYGFDASIMDIFGAILNGATLYPVNLRAEGLTAVIHALHQFPITIYHSTPTVFRHTMATLSPDDRLPFVRLVVLGGEPVIVTDVNQFRHHFVHESILINGLGPTESTLALQYFLDHNTPMLRPTVPVGYPVEGIEVFVLNDSGCEAGLYEVGEIVIQGSPIALGYWRSPELTKRVFSENFDGSTKRYFTGDLGQRLPNGSIEFIGRRDTRVKIRGMRVELGEVEACLAEHPAILQSAVATHPDIRGELTLCAYAVLRPGAAAPLLTELRRFLQLRLPDAMLPTAFLTLDALPQTPTGKLDRSALLTPPAPKLASNRITSPQTAAEGQLATLMAELLGLETMNVDDDFFLSGGHSLLATRLVSHIREHFGVEIPLRQIFETPTAAALALVVAHAEIAQQPILPQPREAYRQSSTVHRGSINET